eukprot:5889887-Pleurochrysis_carterae.AAC.1
MANVERARMCLRIVHRLLAEVQEARTVHEAPSHQTLPRFVITLCAAARSRRAYQKIKPRAQSCALAWSSSRANANRQAHVVGAERRMCVRAGMHGKVGRLDGWMVIRAPATATHSAPS